MMLWFAVGLVFLAEAMIIAGEMFAAKAQGTPFLSVTTHWKLFTLAICGAILLLIAYHAGYREGKNIWIVSAASVSSIVLMEPLLAYMFFRELPERGPLVGIILGSVGLVATLIWR